MEALGGMVRQLIVITVLSLFLELLLPGGALRRYVQVVVGLLIIVTILSAAGNILRRDWSGVLPAVTAGGPGWYGTAGTEKSLEEYRAGLARQIAGLARLHGQLPVADVQVELQQEAGAGWGQVKEIRLVVERGAYSAGPDKGERVREVTVGQPQEGAASNADEFARIIASFYHLAPERVKVIHR